MSSSGQALDLTDVEEALPETTLTSLPDELFLLIAKFLLERDLAGVCLLGATSKARWRMLRKWLSQRRSLNITSIIPKADLSNMSAPWLAPRILQKFRKAGTVLFQKMPKLRVVKVGGSRLHTEWLVKAVRATKKIKCIDLSPTLVETKTIDESLMCCHVAAAYIMGAYTQGSARQICFARRNDHTGTMQRHVLQLWCNGDAVIDLTGDVPGVLMDEGMMILAALLGVGFHSCRTHLRELRLANHDIATAGCASLGSVLAVTRISGPHKQGLPRLTALDLSGNNIDGNGCAALMTNDGIGLKYLSRLDLSHCNFGSNGASVIANAIQKGNMSNMRALKLNSCDIDGWGADELFEALKLERVPPRPQDAANGEEPLPMFLLAKMKWIEYLDLGGNPKLPPKGFAMLVCCHRMQQLTFKLHLPFQGTLSALARYANKEEASSSSSS